MERENEAHACQECAIYVNERNSLNYYITQFVSWLRKKILEIMAFKAIGYPSAGINCSAKGISFPKRAGKFGLGNMIAVLGKTTHMLCVFDPYDSFISDFTC